MGIRHVHYRSDIQFENCRVINNAVGYPSEHGYNTLPLMDEPIEVGSKAKTSWEEVVK